MSCNISISLIQELRKRTGISITKCKQALIESNGNVDLAIENIRKSGLKTDLLKSSRLTTAGLIIAKVVPIQYKGFIMEINCETDFVVKSDIFQEFADMIMNTAINESIDNVSSLKARIEKQRLILIEKVGENIQVQRFKTLSGGFVNSYVHGSKIGVIVSASGQINSNIVKYIAMHIAARNPKYIYVNDIATDVMMRERCIQMSIAMKSSKSQKISEKIVAGRMDKFISEIVLTKQDFIMDINKTVGSILDQYCIKIDNFIRFEVGDNR